jgi:hypothetical protein
MGRVRRRSGWAAAAVGPALLLLCPGGAVAQTLALSAAPNYGMQSSRSTFADGTTSRTESSAFGQTYRLSMATAIYPRLTFSAGGTFDQQIAWETVPGPTSRGDALNWSGFGQLGFGDEVLGGGLGYDRRHEWSASRTAGLSSRSPTLVRDGWSGSLRWAPADLPLVGLTVSRTASFDVGRDFLDQTALNAGLSASYTPMKGLDVSYGLGYSRPEDRITGTTSSTVSNTGRVSYSGNYLGPRGTYFTSYGISTASSDTRAGPGGIVATQRFPITGLSVIEAPLGNPTDIALDPNPALIDGNTGASASVDLGRALSSAGDVRPRHLGVESAFPYPTVSRIFVWVSQPLPAEVWGAFAWTAYRSDDNRIWTPVPLGGSVQFGLLDNRFEIPIQETHARYLKVVTRPLPVGATTDARYNSIVVTEVQTQEVVAVQGHLRTSTTSGDFLASTRIGLLQGRQMLSFDSTFRTAHAGRPVTWNYMLVNGLSYGQPLGAKARLSARADRSDSDAAGVHLASNRLAGSLAYNPLPALSHSLGASSELRQSAAGIGTSWALTQTNRAQILPTVALNAGGTYGRGHSEQGTDSQGASANGGLSLAPHSTTAVNVSYAYSWSESGGGGQPTLVSSGHVLNATASWNPYPALYFAGSMTRTWIATPTTLLSFSAGWSPLRDGEVQLSFNYGESYEDLARRRSRSYGPSLRWNIRPGVYLEAAYGESRTYSPVVNTVSRSFFTSIYVPVL